MQTTWIDLRYAYMRIYLISYHLQSPVLKHVELFEWVVSDMFKRLKTVPEILALPPRWMSEPPQSLYITLTWGTGTNLDIQSSPENSAYPPRPVPRSVANLEMALWLFGEEGERIVYFILMSLMLYSLFGIVWRCRANRQEIVQQPEDWLRGLSSWWWFLVCIVRVAR